MSFSRSVKLFVSQHLTPQAQSAALASYARADVARLQNARRAPLDYTIFVDGREGAAPETVKPQGTIVYRFNGLAEAVAFALGFCIARSPFRTGRYRKSWFLLVDGRAWNADFRDIPAGSEVYIVNTQPYHRKLEMTGGLQRSTTRLCADALRKRSPGLMVSHDFLELPGGPAPAPYRMRGGVVSRRRFQRARMSNPGEMMTYPAVILRWRDA
jgi:hypothetical protein